MGFMDKVDLDTGAFLDVHGVANGKDGAAPMGVWAFRAIL